MPKGPDRFERNYERKREESERHKKSLPGEDDQPLPPPPETIKNPKAQPNRNDPCPCGSGKKFKLCCMNK